MVVGMCGGDGGGGDGEWRVRFNVGDELVRATQSSHVSEPPQPGCRAPVY